MMIRIAICVALALLVVGAFHLIEAKLKRDRLARDRKEQGKPNPEPARLS